MSTNTDKKTLMETYLRRPAAFISNTGQFDSSVKFYTQTKGASIFFLSDRIVFDFEGAPSEDGKQHSRAAIALLFDESRSGVTPQGFWPNAGVLNFLFGNDPTHWNSNVSTYQELLYQELWPGVDLSLKSDGGKLKFNWIVQPGGNPEQIVMRYLGADSLDLDDEGNLLIKHALGTMTDVCPTAFQEIDSGKTEVACSFRLNPTRKLSVGFEIGAYSESAPLCIDPAVIYTTYLGGSGADSITGVTVDPTGSAYFVGMTSSADFPVVAGAYQSTLAGTTNVFISKIAPDGASLIYSTYLGGSGVDAGLAIAIDSSGSAYVTGSTTSLNFPTMGPYQPARAGAQDAFLSKLSPNGGALIYSTYLGGAAGITTGRGIGVNLFGQTFIAGDTSSASFPTTGGAFSTVYGGGASDGFVSLISSGGGTLLASTYLGGAGADVISGLALDASDFVYVTGGTFSADFPVTAGAYQTALAGTENAFVTKLVEDLSTPVFSTYLGGTTLDAAAAVALDSSNLACVTGMTTSNDFPVTVGAYQTTYGGAEDAFITKFSLDGGSLVFSTYLGGSGNDIGSALTFDSTGHVWVAGSTASADFPTTPAVIPSSLTGTTDWFISMLSADGSLLLVSYYLGGVGIQNANGIAVDAQGAVYVVGDTSSSTFPVTPGAFQTVYGGETDGAATKAVFATFQNASVTIMELVSA